MQRIIPVVARVFKLNDTAEAPPEGITELIDCTNELLPEGIRAAQQDIGSFKLKRKRAFSQSVIGVSTAAGTVVGAIPIPIADALILGPIEMGEVNAISKIYKIEAGNNFVNTLVEAGTVGTIAKAAISGIKAIPAVNLAASVLNAIVAGATVATLGEVSQYAFEQIYLGNKTIEDIDWVKKVTESKVSSALVGRIQQAVTIIMEEKPESKDIPKIIMKIFFGKQTAKSGKANNN